MKKVIGTIFAGALMLGAANTAANAANAGEMMMSMMQCSSACNAEYLQCVASAQQLASTPMEGMSQLKSNFMASSECGKAAMACQAGCK